MAVFFYLQIIDKIRIQIYLTSTIREFNLFLSVEDNDKLVFTIDIQQY